MGYLALLFCPDEKTARTVTQVLGELEFSVESCMEPFAAVKKLMGQHFDAVVVDCDNEQNATLLFKSARNSTSNQASLAVAVVEGQAGVAKAFRIGANLVLTKPINIEQAKGTLRVARGLLRKGDPVKPAAPAPAAAPAPTVPPKPVAAKPVPPMRPAPPTTLAAAMAPRPVAPPEVKPVPAQAGPAAAAASSVPAAKDDDLLDIGSGDPVPAPSAEKIVHAAFSGVATPGSPVAGQPVASTSSSAAPVKAASNDGLPVRHGIGAASAPAPAREIQNSQVAETSPAAAPAEVVAPAEKPAETAPSASSSYAGSAPSFTFGGANAPEESSGANKKVLIGVAAAVLVAGVLYFGWTKFQGRSNQPVSTVSQTSPAPVPAPQIPKPSAKADSAIPSTPVPAASLPSSQPEAAPAKNQSASDTATTSDEPASAPTSTKSSSSISPAASKPAPLVLKGGTAPVLQVKSSAPDAPAPSMIGIATAGAGAPPPDLGSTQGTAPTPVLQTLNVSQGVSQGLLTKKIQPVYPRNALAMHLEGSVELQATISKSGDISRVKVLSGDGQLAKAASDAVKQWKYKPYLLNGEPVEIQTQVTINFKLPR